MDPSGRVTVQLGASKQQTFNYAAMVGQSRHSPKAGQLGGPAGSHGEEEQPRLQELYSEAKLRIEDLITNIPTLQMKHANPSEVRHHQKVTKNLMLSKIKEMIDR